MAVADTSNLAQPAPARLETARHGSLRGRVAVAPRLRHDRRRRRGRAHRRPRSARRGRSPTACSRATSPARRPPPPAHWERADFRWNDWATFSVGPRHRHRLIATPDRPRGPGDRCRRLAVSGRGPEPCDDRGSASRSASMSASVVLQPTEMRSERWASTPMASSTGDGSSDFGRARRCPSGRRCRPGRGRAAPACGSMPSMPRQTRWGSAVVRVAVDHATPSSRRRPVEDPVGEAPRQRGLVARSVPTRASAAAAPKPTIAGHVLQPGPPRPLLVAAHAAAARGAGPGGPAAPRCRAGRRTCGR